MSVERAASHYDAVTESWMKWVMGDELHFGLFKTGTETLAEATHNLTVRLAERAELSRGLDVLDVGCGIGTQSMYLASEHGCRALGISTSQVGLDVARARAQERGLAERARFELRDATDNGLPDQSFDRIYSLESAHLMPDKERLFSECFRVLRPGGRLALCDVAMIGTEAGELAYYGLLGHTGVVAQQIRRAVYNTLHRAFGSSILTNVQIYKDAALRAGFTDVEVHDLSAATQRTLHHWGLNANTHRDEIAAELGEHYLDDFFLALLHMSFGWGQLGGYILMTGRRPE